MKKKIVLKFKQPADDDVNERGGQFGAPRKERTHTGLDFLSYLDPAYASESGLVAYSGFREGSTDETNYGNTIVINHTPDIPDDERHIYTLYAHLDKRSARKGQEVRKGKTVGISGNSGTQAYYKKLKRSYHLHFEVIDANRSFDWSTGWPGDLRKMHRRDPSRYIGLTTTIEYDIEGEHLSDSTPFKNLRNPFAPATPIENWYTPWRRN